MDNKKTTVHHKNRPECVAPETWPQLVRRHAAEVDAVLSEARKGDIATAVRMPGGLSIPRAIVPAWCKLRNRQRVEFARLLEFDQYGAFLFFLAEASGDKHVALAMMGVTAGDDADAYLPTHYRRAWLTACRDYAEKAKAKA